MRTTSRSSHAVNALAWLALALPSAAQVSPPAEPVRFGSYRSELVDLARPAAVAVDEHDRVYVVEELAGRVSVFDAAGVRLRAFGELDAAHGTLVEPQGIAVASDGTTYVADSGNDRVCVFDAQGRFARVVGRRGAGPGELSHPMGLALAGERLYVADSRNHRVQVFDDKGQSIRAIGRRGRGQGELFHPVDVAVDPEGRVFVADLDNQRIQKFDDAGKFVASIGDFGPYAGLFASPSGVRCVADRIYVADRDNHRVQVFDQKGAVLYQWGLHVLRPREGAGKLHYPNQVAVAPSGKFAVVAESVENRCQIFEPESEDAPAPLVQDKGSSSHIGAGIDVKKDLCALVEPSTPGALVLDLSTGNAIEITRFGGFGLKPGELVRPIDVALTNDAESVWISDPGSARLSMFRVARAAGEPLRYDPVLARFVKSIDLSALPSGSQAASAVWPIEPGTIECDAAGDLYVADLANARIVVIASDLSIRRTFGSHGRGPGQLLRPTAIAFSRSNELVYVVDAAAQRVQAFDRDGSASFAFGGRGDAAGEFVRPFGCVVGRDGFVYVTDEGADVVQKFDERGRFVARFGRRGLGRIEFFEPQGIACDPRGSLWIVDSGNHRVQVLSADGSFHEAFGSRLYVQPTLGEPR
jgi:DNA-binding beta-propeller fold protein YncE